MEPEGKGFYGMSKLCVGKLWSIRVCFIIVTKKKLERGNALFGLKHLKVSVSIHWPVLEQPIVLYVVEEIAYLMARWK